MTVEEEAIADAVASKLTGQLFVGQRVQIRNDGEAKFHGIGRRGYTGEIEELLPPNAVSIRFGPYDKGWYHIDWVVPYDHS